MQDLVLITPPTVEPISLADAKQHLRVDISDDDAYISGLITAARALLESHTRRTFMTQEWLLKLDGFPGQNPLYNRSDFYSILIPKPPFQSVVSFKYIDVGGVLQTLPVTDQAGVTQGGAMYGYQLDPGGDTQPARVMPPWARPWPPTRRIPQNVLLDFTCGYCAGYYVTLTPTGSPATLDTISGVTFPASEDGKRIYIPGAGPAGTTLAAVLAVDGFGIGTITPEASTPVTTVLAFVGGQVPAEILAAMKLQIAYLYGRRGDDQDTATAPGLGPAVKELLSYYANWIA